MLRRFIRSGRGRALSPSLNQLATTVREPARTPPETKIGQRLLFHFYRDLAETGAAPRLRDTGFRVFSQFEEDGKLLFIFAALNFGWHGVFIDGNRENIDAARSSIASIPILASIHVRRVGGRPSRSSGGNGARPCSKFRKGGLFRGH